jgi:carboxyl-terminal processing protease
MNPYKKNALYAVITTIVFVGTLFLGISIGRGQVQVSKPSTLQNTELGMPAGVDFAPFWKAWNVINEKYVPATTTSKDTLSDQEKVWGAIEGLASSLGDPYTVFFPPVQSEIFEGDVRGNFEGVGMEVGVRDGVLTVIAPLKGTPAYNAGIKPGDKIIEIDKNSTYNLSTEEAVSSIRGKKGTPVVFSVIRSDSPEPLTITVVRDVINIPTINTEMRSDGVFVIELYNFSAASPDLFRKALREFIEARTDKLILDLRGNPGGYLEAAIDMASWFLPPGKVVVQEDFGEKQKEEVYRSRGYDIFNDTLKMVILVDGGSASASEILAGALQEHGVAKLVGEKTYGKGSVQELVKITPDTSLKITIARWLTPEGVSISASGIVPDYDIKNTKEGLEKGVDLQGEKAVEVLKNWKK